MKNGVYIKKGKTGWLWNVVGSNGQIVGNGEVYATKSNAMRSFRAAAKLFRAYEDGSLLIFKEVK